MTIWQFSAAVDGWARANGNDPDDTPSGKTSITPEVFERMKNASIH